MCHPWLVDHTRSASASSLDEYQVEPLRIEDVLLQSLRYALMILEFRLVTNANMCSFRVSSQSHAIQLRGLGE